jgi:photosystem II stability/assembly factor-like uncharacterized protein
MFRKVVVSALVVAAVAAATALLADAPRPGSEDEGREELAMLRGRAQWWFERHRGPGGTIPWNARGKALAQLAANTRSGVLGVKRSGIEATAKASAGASPNAIEGDTWLPIGPRPIADGSYDYSGRITALATVAGSPNVVYAGAAQGGVWKTTDGGAVWVPLTDDQDSLAIGAIALDPANANVVWVGTGEANQSCDSHFGIGLLKSTDGGTSWTNLGTSTFQNTSIAKIVVHPTVSNTIWVANGSGAGGFNCYGRTGTFGVWKTIDGGANWTQVLGEAQTGINAAVHDLICSPTDPNTLYAAAYGSGIWKTVNGGTSWVHLAGGLPTTNVGRFDLGINPANASVLFALVSRASDGAQRGIYRSVDAGANWSTLPIPSGTCQYWSFQDICTYSGSSSGQCWYDLAIEVQSGGTVWAGGTGIFKSTTGGASWTDVCSQSVHVDQHAIAFGSDGRVWVGNDGGVWASSDGGVNWANKNGNLQITQFYPGAALDPSNYDGAMAGAQDNGTPRTTGSTTWDLTTFGDGAACVIDATSPSTTWYTSYQFLNITKTTDGGGLYVGAVNGLLDANTSAAPFIGQFKACPADPGVLIAGSDNVWRTTDAAGVWVQNSPDPLDPSGALVVTLAFAPSDPTCGTYAVGTKAGRVFRTNDAGTTWDDVSVGLPPRALNDLEFDPTDANVLYAAVSGYGGSHLFWTTNAQSPSAAWFTLDAGIPDVPINAVLVDPEEPKVIYAGSDLGLFKSDNGGVSWAAQLNGIPKIAIHDLVADAGTRAFVAFTHGRGAFRLNLICTPPTFGGVEAASDPSACTAGVDVAWSVPSRWGQLATSGSFEVQRFEGADCAGAPAVVGSGLPASTLAYTDTTTILGETYSYRVVATNDCPTPASASGMNACAAPVVDSADTQPCGDVGATLLASRDLVDATLSWGAVACGDLAAYGVYGAASYSAAFPSEWILLGSPAAAPWNDPLASDFVAYRVVSMDVCGNPSAD